MARISSKAVLWKTMDFGMETNFSRPTAVLWGSVKEMDRLIGEAKTLKVQNEEQFGALREANIYGLFFGTILATAFDKAREQSGAIAALLSVSGGYLGAAVDTAISWLLDKLPEVKKKLEDIALTMGTIAPWIRQESEKGGASGFFWEIVEVVLLPPEISMADNIKKGEEEQVRSKARAKKPLDEGVAAGPGVFKTQSDEMSIEMEVEGWDHLNTAQTAKNETTEYEAAKELAEANERIAKGLDNYNKNWSKALARMYFLAYHNSPGMRQVYAGRAHKNR